MFGNDRDSMRRYYLQCWHKFRQKLPMDALEQSVAQVIAEHPEYHTLLEQADKALQRDYLPENGNTNPFLHMGLHLGIREQVATNRPLGISAIHQQLASRHGILEAEHRMMDCLAESIWLAQRNQTMPDEKQYLQCLQALFS
ncbi:MAG TPA: DUF1841 family protein [Candidatus Thiothrix moscowensis]|uniref:DUF1841 family protein n=1 Tax=unclassified Thiothrix TaxID=2636184 RepID=UPI001A29D0D4|nr:MULTISPECIES: DUF1841 family protein [unclassified Thiothrix]MBJ6610160.1 DUF1841 family protein [Candidatus Thiothrix moscowensis]HRJ53526.1 DUF1841 family protein [Candidatus Thiothrix moscowensis]HRJ93666.1 DUF1841 family protein [Candidatus Thiothrix moscowensis]